MAIQLYEPWEHKQTTAAAVWDIYHKWKREVSVTIWDESGKKIQAKVERVNNEHVRISFFENGAAKAMKGRAVIG